MKSASGTHGGREVGDAGRARGDRFVLLVLSAVCWAAGCYAAHGASDGGAADWSTDADAPVDAAPPPRLPHCGDGRVDEGEGCDDGTRLDGDGCDWLCRVGWGESPPEPDPTVPPYAPTPGARDAEVSDVRPFAAAGARIPVVWTGTELAVAVYESSVDGDRRLRVQRFDVSGRPAGDGWSWEVVGLILSSPELLWTGDGFAVFFVDPAVGILFVRLDAAGVELGEPVVVVPEPEAREPSAAEVGGGFVLAWAADPAGDSVPRWCQIPAEPRAIRVRVVREDGSSAGLPGPVTIEEDAGWPPDVAASGDGFAVTLSRNRTTEDPACPVRVVRLDGALGEATDSGTLSGGGPAEVHATAGGYVVSWLVAGDAATRGRDDWCLALFSGDGDLVRSPLCKPGLSAEPASAIRLAAGDRGYALVGRSGIFPLGLIFLRTDLSGAAVNAFSVGDVTLGGFGVTWAGDGFAVAYTLDSAWGRPLYLARFGIGSLP